MISITVVEVKITDEESLIEAPPKPKSQVWANFCEEVFKICISMLIYGIVSIMLIVFYAWMTEAGISLEDVFHAILTKWVSLPSR